MAITLNSVGAYASGVASVTPTLPAHAAEDLLVLTVFAKPTNTAVPPIFSTPLGWTAQVNGNDGSGTAQGLDAGQVWVATYALLAASSAETNPTVAVTNGNVCMGSVNCWRKTAAGAWSVQGVVAGDTTSTTAWSTAHAAMGLAPGDAVDYRCAASGNSSGGSASIFPASASVAATGHTFTAQTAVTAANTANGNDMAAGGYNWLVDTGTSASVTATVTATLLAAQKGVAVLFRLREPVAIAGSQATGTSTAFTGTPRVVVAGQQVTGTATANPGTATIPVAGSQAAATGTAFPGTADVRGPVGQQATETTTAFAGTPRIIVAGSQAVATGQATTGTPTVATPGAQATETDTGFAGTANLGDLAVAGSRATETDTPTGGARVVAAAGSRAITTDTAAAGSPTVAAVVAGNQASVTTTAASGGVAVTGSQALETDTAFTGSTSSPTGGDQATETATAFAGTPRIIVVGSRAETTVTASAGSVIVPSPDSNPLTPIVYRETGGLSYQETGLTHRETAVGITYREPPVTTHRELVSAAYREGP